MGLALKTPDVTPAQIIAVAGSVIGVAVAFGADLSTAQSDQIMQLISIVAPILLGADATVRVARAKYLGKRIT
jgi:drug/metabolite transporter (DMT)-like permease